MAQTILLASRGRMCSLMTAVVCVMAIFAACERAHISEMGICKPISQRTEEVGCWIITNEALGRLPERQIFWHLDAYPTRATAEAAKGPRGTVVEAFGRIWLFTIAEADWRPSGGERVAEIGPLPVRSDTDYTAQTWNQHSRPA